MGDNLIKVKVKAEELLLNRENVLEFIDKLVYDKLSRVPEPPTHMIINEVTSYNILEPALNELMRVNYGSHTTMYPLSYININGVKLKVVRTKDVPELFIEIV